MRLLPGSEFRNTTHARTAAHRRARPRAAAHRRAGRLWDVSEELTGARFAFAERRAAIGSGSGS
jgi:hypothetical protein